ncbi:Penicillin amidase superfamily [uncultured Coleofasciculus sp.]|uniref:Penicillin amidase superfamily n=1 Tax=uncultured Coleofasciculus sp. TaxID=1267456 RepID=A0A6J4K392_9CYAN|nr:Penicillin amidase superfamily [uncultured Coleofasciculus sp.]
MDFFIIKSMNFAQLLNRFRQRLIWVFPLLLGFTLAICLSFYIPASSLERTEILWDRWGVPHIYGKDTQGLFQAFGWAQMQSHGDLILRLYGQARGRAAEYFGEKYLQSDQYVRTMGIPARAKDWYKQQNPTMQGFLDAFAIGINNYAKENPDKINDEVKAVLPVDGVDVLAHVQRVIHFTFVVNQDEVKSQASTNKITPGSNGWAIAPSHSSSGNAMLLANPHLPWSDLFLWYEAQLTAPGIDAYGAALVGMPVLAIAFNNNLGWTSTVNTHDGWDAYELKLADNGYVFDGKVRPFETETQTLKIKQANGKLREEPLLIQHSIHGPIIDEQKNDKKAIALRVVGLEQPNMMEQFWDMARASNLNEFEAALKRLQLPMFNIIYADKNGHILYVFNGQVPIHTQGNWNYWQGIIPGDTSATLWTKTHPYRDLPRVLDPPSGWLQNANDPPWTTTFPPVLNPNNYPPYISPRFMGLRAQRSAKMLLEKPKISFEEMIADKFSSRLELADRVLDDLIVAARKEGSEIGRQAADVLSRWDRQTEANSRGAVLFAAWARSMPPSKLFATRWNENSPLDTPKNLADPASAVKLLEAAATTVKLLYGALDVPWGEVARLRYGNVDLPVSGGPGLFGIFRVIDLIPAKDGNFQQFSGDSYVAAIEFSNPVRAKVLITYGNATQPGSPHVGDQLPLYARNELRPAWRTRKEVEAHLEARKVF